MILVPSIPHTGTHFVRDHLLRDCPIPVKCEHIFHNSRVDLERIARRPKVTTIVPIRHPLAVVASWRARGKSCTPLMQFWDDLVEHIVPHGPLCIPLDVGTQRGFWLAMLNRHLAVAYGFKVDAGDWPVLREEGRPTDSSYFMTAADLALGRDIALRHENFLSAFYGPSLLAA